MARVSISHSDTVMSGRCKLNNTSLQEHGKRSCMSSDGDPSLNSAAGALAGLMPENVVADSLLSCDDGSRSFGVLNQRSHVQGFRATPCTVCSCSG